MQYMLDGVDHGPPLVFGDLEVAACDLNDQNRGGQAHPVLDHRLFVRFGRLVEVGFEELLERLVDRRLELLGGLPAPTAIQTPLPFRAGVAVSACRQPQAPGV